MPGGACLDRAHLQQVAQQGMAAALYPDWPPAYMLTAYQPYADEQNSWHTMTLDRGDLWFDFSSTYHFERQLLEYLVRTPSPGQESFSEPRGWDWTVFADAFPSLGLICLEGRDHILASLMEPELVAWMEPELAALLELVPNDACAEWRRWEDYLLRACYHTRLDTYVWHQHQFWAPAYAFAQAARDATR